MQPIELVEGILRQNLTPISRAPHKCDIWNQSDCLACVLEIHFGVSAKASWRYRAHYRPEDGLRRCPDVQLLLETAMSITRAYHLFPICSKIQAG